MPSKEALIVVDLQNDFCPGGNLPVAEGDAILPAVNRLVDAASHVILTQDWHPPAHQSFASSHINQQPFDSIEVDYGPQTLWPDHCVQGTHGAQFHPMLNCARAEMIIRKGFRPEIDSYSAFFENDRTTTTGLAGYLRERGLERLVLCGLATDVCVAWSALDARRLGFQCDVVLSACRAIDLGDALNDALVQMQSAGVNLRES